MAIIIKLSVTFILRPSLRCPPSGKTYFGRRRRHGYCFVFFDLCLSRVCSANVCAACWRYPLKMKSMSTPRIYTWRIFDGMAGVRLNGTENRKQKRNWRHNSSISIRLNAQVAGRFDATMHNALTHATSISSKTKSNRNVRMCQFFPSMSFLNS